MQTTNTISIQAPWDRVFDAVAQVEHWPQILSHYRTVKVLSDQGDLRRVDMAAHRDGIPCRWVSDMTLHRAEKKIHFYHVQSRFTQGMDVWWIFKPSGPDSTDIVLTHDSPRGPWWRAWFDQNIIADGFVHNIAGKTQAGLNRHLEVR